MKAFVCVLAVLVATCSAGFIGGRGGVVLGGGPGYGGPSYGGSVVHQLSSGGPSFGGQVVQQLAPGGPSYGGPVVHQLGPAAGGVKYINVVRPQQPAVNVIHQQPAVQVLNGAGYSSGGHAYPVGYSSGVYSSGGAGGYYGGGVQIVQQPIAPVQHLKQVQVVHQQLPPVQHVKHIQVVPQQLKAVEVIQQQPPPHYKTIQVLQGGSAVLSGGYSYETAAPGGYSYVADGGVYGSSGYGALEAVKSFKSIGGHY